MAAPLVPEPAGETRARRWVLLSFLLFYACVAPLWYATSRVNRETLPDLDDHLADASPHVLPLQLRVVDLSSDAKSNHAEWLPQVSSELHTRLTALSAKDSADAVTPFQWRVMDARFERVEGAQLAALQTDAHQLDDALLSLAEADATPAAADDTVSLPKWHLFVLVVADEPTSASDGGVWTMGRHRHAFTRMAASSSTEQRRQRMAQAATLMHSLAQSQSCIAPAGGAPISPGDSSDRSACAGSRSLSQRLSFTLLNGGGDEVTEAANAQAEEWTWDFGRIEKAYLSRFLDLLAPFVAFTVDSSVAHYAHLTDADATRVDTEMTQLDTSTIGQLPQPLRAHVQQRVSAADGAAAEAPLGSRSNSAWLLPASSLKNLIGSVGEWNAPSPLVSHSMELLAYIPPPSQRPLLFRFAGEPSASAVSSESDVAALFVPRFGGVLILNHLGASCARNDSDASVGACELPVSAQRDMMQVFIEQIRQTLAFSQQVDQCPSCVLLPSPSLGVSAWELDLLSSRVVRANLRESVSMLRGLYALLESVPHMPVSEHIRHLVEQTLTARDACRQQLRRADWTGAGRSSQRAVGAASQAFFHPDLLPALYFPDEHLYAVYLPLFLPITVPLLAALLKILAPKKKTPKAVL